MKNIPVLAGIAMLFAVATECRSAVITGDAAFSNYGEDKILYLSKSIPAGQGLCAFQIQPHPLTASAYKFASYSIAEKCALFDVVSGVSFDPTYVSNQTPLVENGGNPGSGTAFLAHGDVKYFGYWDDRSGIDRVPGVVGGPDEHDLFGWVSIQSTIRGLVIRSSATALGGGIIIGTTTQIPEPSAASLLLGSGAISLACWRRRARSRPHCPAQPVV